MRSDGKIGVLGTADSYVKSWDAFAIDVSAPWATPNADDVRLSHLLPRGAHIIGVAPVLGRYLGTFRSRRGLAGLVDKSPRRQSPCWERKFPIPVGVKRVDPWGISMPRPRSNVLNSSQIGVSPIPPRR